MFRIIPQLPWLTAIVWIFVSGLATPPTAAQELLTLRTNDTAGRPGNTVAAVVRTYSPRGISLGQLCMRSRSPDRAGVSPFVALEGYIVFSEAGDVISEGSFEPGTQTAILEFESLSGTINWADGPMLALFFQLDPSLTPGQTFEIEIDPTETFLIDAEGQPVPVRLRSGDLDILAPTQAVELGAEGAEVVAGEVAQLGVSTTELFPVRAGQAAFVYDPAIASGPPQVTMDPRHGDADFTVDLPAPGRVVVSFDSADASLNTLPGNLISIDLPTAAGVPPGTVSQVSLDPADTWLQGSGGQPLLVAIEADVIEFVLPEPLFTDGFESGDLGQWSRVRP